MPTSSTLPVRLAVTPPLTGLTVQALTSGSGDTTPLTVDDGALVVELAPGATSLATPVIWVASEGPWAQAVKQPEPGDVVVIVGVDAPAFQAGAMIAVTDGGAVPAVTVPLLAALLSTPAPPAPAPPPAPTHVTPTADYAWDGSDRHHVSADTSVQDITILVPYPAADADPRVVDHELSVINRTDGGTGNTVRVAISDVCPTQGDVVLAVGQSVRLRAIVGGFDVLPAC